MIKDTERWCRDLFREALSRKATDIHFLPQSEKVSVLFRIQSKIVRHETISFDDYRKVSYHLKQLAGVNTVSRAPQDGRITFEKEPGREVHFRFASVWSKPLKTDKIAIRLVEKDPSLLKLENLSFEKSDLTKLKASLRKSFGMVLVVGPTGSGKTTTLYACLNYVKELEDRIILTIEDPVEYFIEKTAQVEVTSSVSFDDVLRNFLRQDPDVIMIGEIRDRETAGVAIRSALTGHLVLSTLHANTALLSVSRLVDLGMDPFNLAFVLNVIQSQRLVRKLCPYCRREVQPDDLAELFYRRLGKKLPEVLYEENNGGCENCIGGSVGRTAVYELIFFDQSDQSELYRMLKTSGHFEREYTEYLKSKYGHKTLVERAAEMAERGEIAFSEALKLL